jgi:hypothetical protein
MILKYFKKNYLKLQRNLMNLMSLKYLKAYRELIKKVLISKNYKIILIRRLEEKLQLQGINI